MRILASFLLIIFLCSCATLNPNDPSTGILMLRSDSGDLCTSFLVADDVVVTAMHCIQRSEKSIWVMDGRRKVYVKKIGFLQSYKFKQWSTDVAVLKLYMPVDKDRSHFLITDDIPNEFTLIGYKHGVIMRSGPAKTVFPMMGTVYIESDSITGGMSGSPLFFVGEDGKLYAFGVLAWRSEDNTGGGPVLNFERALLVESFLIK